MKYTKELAYLRQLCCLGLPKEIAVAEFIRSVHPLIPSENNVFIFVNALGYPVYPIMEVFLPETLEPATEQMPKFYNKLDNARLGLDSGAIVTDIAAFCDDFYQSDMYNLVWRPANQHFMMMTDIYRHQRFMGRLMLFRPKNASPFKVSDQNFCRQLRPYLAHALHDSTQVNLAFQTSGGNGLVIADKTGRILYLSDRAKYLLLLATQSPSHSAHHLKNFQLPAAMSAICKNLDGIFKNKSSPVPTFTVNNNDGRFIFTAYWLESHNSEQGGLVGVAIEHQEPEVLKVLRVLKDLSLSPTQKEVALMMTQGLNNPEIGQRLHIKQTTVKDHISKIFTKLDICSREELMPLLLAKADNKTLYH